MDEKKIIDQVVQYVKKVRGVQAIVLGGSRAKGTHTRTSDIDIGIYYSDEKELDLDTLEKIAMELDDLNRGKLVTSIGEWGPWINGGGWLKINGLPVDFLYRDLSKVSAVMEGCRDGNISLHYQPGHPFGFLNYIYLGEIAICQPFWDPYNEINKLKALTHNYPPRLKNSIVTKFFWEARFSLENAKKGTPLNDSSYISGCMFRSVSCLTQVLFALNECFYINEKGAVKAANQFPYIPDRFERRINKIFTSLSTDEGISNSFQILDEIIHEVEKLIQNSGFYK
ncbi:nucleotidyltransferase domain-containing protein [Bacillus sp. Marseille-Q3570]|uniref:nucleotidyltransferase domain-containing protein n=1 Tax=Bacillus sp. Marseille-Q3570 TaxID=2963522 RepID=UPI0021B829B3|nr:nucleotidyltransferase domain-containing protein [Bacillus sp. Marseille-Q3570]